MTINNDSIVRSVTLKVRALLASGITDPVLASRPSNSNFVITDSQRPFFTPEIQIHNVRMSDTRNGLSNSRQKQIDMQIDVWSQSPKGRDILIGSIDTVLGSCVDSTAGTLSEGLYNYKLVNSFPLDDPENDGGLKRFRRGVMEVKYFFDT